MVITPPERNDLTALELLTTAFEHENVDFSFDDPTTLHDRISYVLEQMNAVNAMRQKNYSRPVLQSQYVKGAFTASAV